jgi:hypothetical protein
VLEGVLDHRNGLDAWEAAASGQPIDRVADDMVAGFDAAAVGIDGPEGLQFRGRGVVETAFDVAMQRGLVVLDGEQVVGLTFENCGGNPGLTPPSGLSIRLRLTEPLASLAHGVDGEQRALQFKAPEQQRDDGDLVGFDVPGLLAKHQPLG